MLLIKNGTIKTMAGPDIEGGQLLLDGDKIVAVGQTVDAPADAEVLDASGCLVTPGFVEGHCHIGMMEELVGWAGNDTNEITNPITPQMRGMDGFNPMDEAIPEAAAA
ncbi:MAG: amidohydrolase, partial [Oscillospiraceae bacterium]|nr:amidohydrolase [Oscillospiraceae bacterium]